MSTLLAVLIVFAIIGAGLLALAAGEPGELDL